MNKVSVCIPVYNNAKTLDETLVSVKKQDYSNIETIISDNCSTDNSVEIIKKYKVKLYTEKNRGIGPNLENCIKKATGKYVVFMSADDLFTNPKVISDIVKIFESNKKIGYIGRWYYQFMNNHKGAIRIHRSVNPLFQSDNPSGLAFRREALSEKVSNTMFIEAASIVKQVLDAGWDYDIIKYDTVAVRIHPGGNTATKSFYYKNSPTMSWTSLIGKQEFILTSYISLIQLKNWASLKTLLNEILVLVKLRPKSLLRIDFWFFVSVSLLTPRCILRRLTNFYKHRIVRHFVDIVERPERLK